MKARLFCTTGILAGTKYEFAQQATIGKDKSNSLVLAPPVISDQHARIFYDSKADSFFLEDMGSRNGTKLDGMKVTRRERLGPLHVITLAKKFDFVFQVVDEAAQPAKVRNGERTIKKPQTFVEMLARPERPKEQAAGPFWSASPIRKKRRTRVRQSTNNAVNGKTLIEELLKSAPNQTVQATGEREAAETLIEMTAPREAAKPKQISYALVASIDGKELGSFPLREGENVIGRAPECNVRIDEPSISRRHAVLALAAGKVTIKDLGSRNHTFINKARIATEREIDAGVALQFGVVEAELHSV